MGEPKGAPYECVIVRHYYVYLMDINEYTCNLLKNREWPLTTTHTVIAHLA